MKLQKIMNIALRSCLNKSREDSVYKMHIESKVLPLDIRCNIALLKLMFNNINKNDSPNELECTSIHTRSSKFKNFKIARPHYEWFRKSVAYQGKKG